MYSIKMREKDPNNPRTQIQLRREAAVRALLGRTDGKLSQEIIEDLKKDLALAAPRPIADQDLSQLRDGRRSHDAPCRAPQGSARARPETRIPDSRRDSQLLFAAVAAEI